MASGDSLITFYARDNEPPTTATEFATPGSRAGAAGQLIEVLLFDDTAADEKADFGGAMPLHYAGTTGITVTIGYMMTTDITGTMTWSVAFKSVTDDVDDMDTKAFAAANTISPTVPTAAGEIGYEDVTFTDGADMDSVAAGEYFRMRVMRTDTGGGGGDAELVFVAIKET